MHYFSDKTYIYIYNIYIYKIYKTREPAHQPGHHESTVQLWRTLHIWPSMRCILWTSFWTSSLKHILCVVNMLWKCIKHQTMSLSSRNKSLLSTRVQDWWQVPRKSSDCVDTRFILFEMMCGYYPTADDLHTISESTWYRPGLSQGEVISKEQRGAILIVNQKKAQ